MDPRHPGEGFTSALVKHDLLAGTSEVHGFAGDAAVGEGACAAVPGSTVEDDGHPLLGRSGDVRTEPPPVVDERGR